MFKGWQFFPLLIGVVACASHHAGGGDAVVERRIGVMGTWLDVRIAAPTRDAALKASEAVIDEMHATVRRLSTWSQDTELARVNRDSGSLRVSQTLAEDLSAALECARVTGGGFDPTVAALSEAWQLRRSPQRPSPTVLAQARSHVGYQRVVLRDLRLEKPDGVRFDEGGFGKGVALKRAMSILRDRGIVRAELNLGGQLAVLGATGWTPIAHPHHRDRPAVEVPLSSGSLATSGNSERGGESAGHILDPRTGNPAPDFGSLTVRAADPVLADCLSTGLYALGPEAALAFAEQTEDVEVVVGLLSTDGNRVDWKTGGDIELREVSPP